MEVIKSAGVYNCHIDDLYKSAEPAEAQSTTLSTEPPHKELFAQLPGQGTGLVGARTQPWGQSSHPHRPAHHRERLSPDWPHGRQKQQDPLLLSMDAITCGLILATAKSPVTSGG